MYVSNIWVYGHVQIHKQKRSLHIWDIIYIVSELRVFYVVWSMSVELQCTSIIVNLEGWWQRQWTWVLRQWLRWGSQGGSHYQGIFSSIGRPEEEGLQGCTDPRLALLDSLWRLWILYCFHGIIHLLFAIIWLDLFKTCNDSECFKSIMSRMHLYLVAFLSCCLFCIA